MMWKRNCSIPDLPRRRDDPTDAKRQLAGRGFKLFKIGEEEAGWHSIYA
jgi:hypothetical protein